MSDLANQFVVVAGGAGEVGEGIVAALLRQGAFVLVPSRSARKLAAMQDAVAAEGPGRLSLLEADIGTSEGRAKLRSVAEASGPLRAIVASLGGFWQGPRVLDVPPAAFEEVMAQRFAPHLHLVQTLMPLLRGPGSSLVQVNGLAAVVSIPGLSALAVSCAAQLALTRRLIAEADAGSPRIASLLIEQWVRTRSMQHLPDDALTAREVGSAVVRFVTSATDHAILRLGKADGAVTVAPLEASAASLSSGRVLAEWPAGAGQGFGS